MLDEWEEMHVRSRRLVTPAQAVEMIAHGELRQIIADFFVKKRL
jgi:hypothetical protein